MSILNATFALIVNTVAADDVEAAIDDVAVAADAEELDCGRIMKVAKT